MSITETADTPQAASLQDDHAHDEIITSTGLKMIYATLALVVALWGLAVATWGVPGLYLPAVAFVPVMYGILIVISKG